MKYVGLTDDPEARRISHGSPPDWWHRKFQTEKEARDWEKQMLDQAGHKGAPGGKGWKHGYTYTITSTTSQ